MSHPNQSPGNPSYRLNWSSFRANLSQRNLFHVTAILAIVIFGLASYSNSFGGPFVFDDERNIVENRALYWTTIDWSRVTAAVRASPSASRPVANVSFALNYYFGRHNVWGYHGVNISIHLVTALLVYLLALATLRRADMCQDDRLQPSVVPWIALATALIFVCHPMQTQSVSYTVQRMTSLCGMLYLAALLLYVYGRATRSLGGRWMLWVGGLACWLLALGSKQISATLPLIVLMYEWYFFQDLRRSWLRRGAMTLFSLCAVVGLVSLIFLGSFKFPQQDFTIAERLLTQFRVLVLYMSLLVFPHPVRLNLAHDMAFSQYLLQPRTTLLAMSLVFSLLGVTAYLARKHRLVSFCLLWFFVNLVIESTVIPLALIFEHRLYLPMFGFSLLMAWLLFALCRRRVPVAIGLVAAVAVLLAMGTHQRNEVWRSELALWVDAVSKSPRLAVAHNNLGNALQNAGQLNRSITHYQAALRLDPIDPEALNNLGVTLDKMGRFEEAVARFEQSLRIAPKFAEAHSNVGATLGKLGRYREAIEHLLVARQLRPQVAKTHYNLGRALFGMGQRADSIVHYAEALRLDPNYADAHYNLGSTLAHLGRFQEAAVHYREVLRLKPDDAEAHFHLATVLRVLGHDDEARKHFDEAQRLKAAARN